MTKNLTRHEAIKELLTKRQISDQQQLVDLLRKEFAIETTQAVISRDFKKLDVVKKRHSYELPSTDINSEILKLAIIDIVHNEAMIVIHTHPALADFVGDCIDYITDLDILGCLGGENSVFVAPKSVKDIHKTYLQICEKLHFKKRSGA